MTGDEWIERANARFLGKTEFRQVTMEVGGNPTPRILYIRTLRETDGHMARTVFCVMQPWHLSNINYVVTEYCGRIEPFEIQLYLPFVRGTLRNVSSEKRREGHLGSDFSYDDMRTWLYQDGHTYSNVVEMNSWVRVLGKCTSNCHLVRHGSAPFNVYIDRDSAFLHRIDYLTTDGMDVIREYRASNVQTINGITFAGQMEMYDHARSHRTVIRLERIWFDQQIEKTVFDANFRKHTRDYLESL